MVEPTSSLVWSDIILTNFQRVISRHLLDISTYLSCTAQRVIRTIFMQKSEPKYAYLPGKIVEVWIDRFCIHYVWWRRLQPMSSVSLVWILETNRIIWYIVVSNSVACEHWKTGATEVIIIWNGAFNWIQIFSVKIEWFIYQFYTATPVKWHNIVMMKIGVYITIDR